MVASGLVNGMQDSWPYIIQLQEHGKIGDFQETRCLEQVFALPSSEANVRQILGRPAEVWGAESGADKLVVITTE